MIHVDPTPRLHMCYQNDYYRNRRTFSVDDDCRDASNREIFISSDVKSVGLLTIERIVLFNSVNCAIGKVSDPESLLFYVGFDTPGRLTPETTGS
jgi:hypothetical protein